MSRPTLSAVLDHALVLFEDYPCSYWRGRVPRQGWLYLSVNYLCFHSTTLGKEITLVVKFTDITVSCVRCPRAFSIADVHRSPFNEYTPLFPKTFAFGLACTNTNSACSKAWKKPTRSSCRSPILPRKSSHHRSIRRMLLITLS